VGGCSYICQVTMHIIQTFSTCMLVLNPDFRFHCFQLFKTVPSKSQSPTQYLQIHSVSQRRQLMNQRCALVAQFRSAGLFSCECNTVIEVTIGQARAVCAEVYQVASCEGESLTQSCVRGLRERRTAGSCLLNVAARVL